MTVAVDQLSLHGTREPLPRWVRLLDTAALALLVTAVLLIPGDGIRFGIGPIRISIVSAARVAMWAALVIVARHAFYRTPAASGSRRRLASQRRRMARRQVRWPGPARDPSPSDPDRPAGRRGDRHRNAGRLPAIREPVAQSAREMGCDLVFADCRVRLHLRRQSAAAAEHRVLSGVSARDSSGQPVHGRTGVLRGVGRGAGGIRARHPPARAAGAGTTWTSGRLRTVRGCWRAIRLRCISARLTRRACSCSRHVPCFWRCTSSDSDPPRCGVWSPASSGRTGGCWRSRSSCWPLPAAVAGQRCASGCAV